MSWWLIVLLTWIRAEHREGFSGALASTRSGQWVLWRGACASTMSACFRICGYKPRKYSCVVNFLTQIGSKKNHKLSAKFTYTSISELHALIKSHRCASSDGVVLFIHSKSYRSLVSGEVYDYQWMELTDLSHPSELPNPVSVYIADPKGNTTWDYGQICLQDEAMYLRCSYFTVGGTYWVCWGSRGSSDTTHESSSLISSDLSLHSQNTGTPHYYKSPAHDSKPPWCKLGVYRLALMSKLFSDM